MPLHRRGRDRPTPFTRALAALAERGRVGAELGWRLDMVRALGPVAAARHLRPGSDPSTTWEDFHRRIWQEAADAVGAELEDLGAGFLVLRRGGRSTTVWQYHVMLDDPVTLRLALDKRLGHRLLAVAGLPVPSQLEFALDDLGAAQAFLAGSPSPCVVKPASGTGGGHGVTCGIARADDLVRACVRACRWDRRLLIERQAAGDEYRLLVCEGELLDVIRRRPPVLVADGRSTVRQLVEAENVRRAALCGWAGLRPIDIDLDCLFTLRAAGLTLRSVLPEGRPIRVKSTANSSGPSDNETVHAVSAELVAEAVTAARVLGVRLAGVEVITPDPGTSLRRAGGVVVEVNGTPGLHYHYLVANPERSTAVAAPILSRLLAPEADQPIATHTASANAAVPTT